MHRLSNKKKLAELKASLDILQEKYKDEKYGEAKEEKKKEKNSSLQETSLNIKHVIEDYISKMGNKKFSRKEETI